MPDHAPSIDIECPYCQAHSARVTVRSQTIATLACAVCGHPWSVEVADVPVVQRQALSLPPTWR